MFREWLQTQIEQEITFQNFLWYLKCCLSSSDSAQCSATWERKLWILIFSSHILQSKMSQDTVQDCGPSPFWLLSKDQHTHMQCNNITVTSICANLCNVSLHHMNKRGRCSNQQFYFFHTNLHTSILNKKIFYVRNIKNSQRKQNF